MRRLEATCTPQTRTQPAALRRSLADNDSDLIRAVARHTDHQHQKWAVRSAEADAADRASSWILAATEIL
jgi:hypothetical protein